MPITRRCHLHGGRAGRPRGTPEHPASRAARLAGRQRWVERMRLAKAQGLIAKIPGGRKPGVRIGVCDRVRSLDPSQARRERIAQKEIEMALKEFSAIPDKPKEEMSGSELFNRKLHIALLHDLEILERPIDWDNIEMLKLKTTVALAAQSAAVRLRVAELSPRADDGVVNRLMAKVAAIRRGEKVIEIEPDAKTVEPTG
jgi:hypothetical protein